ncbi:MAG: hypothetical protein ACOVMI_00380 [Chitinophagaceae bacterium]|jgi:hypothetical protein
MTQSKENASIIKMQTEELNHLVNEVKETVVNKTQFSAADLWNIQRNMKLASRSHNKWILN